MTKQTVIRAAVASAVFALATATPHSLTAQLANASAVTLGQGGNATATARGFAAVASNPAGLGMYDSPGFSLALAPLRLRTGLDPVTMADLVDVQGQVISSATKEEWLTRIAANGGQTGAFGVRVSALALSAGAVGFQLSTLVSGSMTLAPGVAEALLYGNAGRTGQPTDVEIEGSRMDGFAVSTAAVSFGIPVGDRISPTAIGATLTYSVGHGVLLAEGSTGALRSDPIQANVVFPTVMTDDEDASINGGSGVGLNLGFVMERDRMTFGVSAINLVSTFEWDTERLIYRPGTALIEEGNNATDFEKQAYGSAPATLRATLEEMTFLPTLAVGGAYEVNEDFTVMADVRNRFGDGGLDVGPRFHAGVGADFRALEVLQLRAGAAVITDGVQFGGGASLVLGPVRLSAAGARRQGDLDDATLAQFTLSFGGH